MPWKDIISQLMSENFTFVPLEKFKISEKIEFRETFVYAHEIVFFNKFMNYL